MLLSRTFLLQLRQYALEFCINDVFYVFVIDSAWGFSCHSNINYFCNSSPHFVIFLNLYSCFFLSLSYCTFDSTIYLRGYCQYTTKNNSFGIRCTYTIYVGLIWRGISDFYLYWLWVINQLSCIFFYFLGNFFMVFLFLCDISVLG